MTRIISVHSFRGGAGKSNLTANLAYLLFEQGRKVAIIDADIQSPGIHILFGLDSKHLQSTLNDYLWGKKEIGKIAIDLADSIDSSCKGKLYIIPSSLSASDIAKILREGYDTDLLIQGYYQIIEDLQLDDLLIDTHPGIGENTLLSISISDKLFIILRPDKQDYQGTAVAVELAKKLEVPSMNIIVNKALASFDAAAIVKEVEKAFDTPVAGIIPFSEEMMAFASSGIFCQSHPNHPITKTLRSILASMKD